MKYSVSPDGVQVLKSEAASLRNSRSEIRRSVEKLQCVSEENKVALGPHITALNEALECIMTVVQQAGEPLETVADVLQEVAESYEEIIANNPFAKARMFVENAVQKASCALGIGNSSNNKSAAQSTFGIFETAPTLNGSEVWIKGSHFDEFYDMQTHPDDWYGEPYSEPALRQVPSSAIEGIHLGLGEAGDPSIFWSQHEHTGTEKSFQDIAQHLPEIKSRLAAGESLNDLRHNPELQKCIGIYYDNAPTVEECGGYYVFSGNGRHRILAARDLGYTIPVRVIGKRKHKS